MHKALAIHVGNAMCICGVCLSMFKFQIRLRFEITCNVVKQHQTAFFENEYAYYNDENYKPAQ